ncbi:hypothetical protein FHR49_000720 [Xanthomonas campestris]
MIRLRLTELIADASFRRGRRVELLEVVQATGIHRTTLSRMGNIRGYSATLSNMMRCGRFSTALLAMMRHALPVKTFLQPPSLIEPPRRRLILRFQATKSRPARAEGGDSADFRPTINPIHPAPINH